MASVSRALILIDVHRDLLAGEGAIPDADDVAPRLEHLLAEARQRGIPVVHVLHDGGESAFDPGLEHVVRSSVGNAFQQNPTLDDHLKSLAVSRVVIAGMRSDGSVLETSLGALQLGFDVDLASGAHATHHGERRAEEISAGIERELADHGASIVWWREVLA